MQWKGWLNANGTELARNFRGFKLLALLNSREPSFWRRRSKRLWLKKLPVSVALTLFLPLPFETWKRLLRMGCLFQSPDERA